ncbi:unnamed protein product [Prunus armeniaca]
MDCGGRSLVHTRRALMARVRVSPVFSTHFLRRLSQSSLIVSFLSSWCIGYYVFFSSLFCSPWGGCVNFLSGFPRSQSLVKGLHLNVIEVATAFSAQRDDKYAAPNGNQKLAETGVRHLIVSGIYFSSKCSFCIEDFVDKAEETSLEGSLRSP